MIKKTHYSTSQKLLNSLHNYYESYKWFDLIF
jgi:hypothetical protein